MEDLTKYDYGYLKGDEEMWPRWGAALGVVSEWCRNEGYGEFGAPTERGRKAMERYEQQTRTT
jgi:hypothetical protein